MGDVNQKIDPCETLFTYIPQRPPMVMIDTLVKADKTEYVSLFEIKADNIFVEGKYLREPGLIENIAQTSAAGLGSQYRARGQSIPLGFIGAVQKLEIRALPEIGDCLKTVVNLVHTVMNISVIDGMVYNQGTLIAHCSMKLVLQEEQG